MKNSVEIRRKVKIHENMITYKRKQIRKVSWCCIEIEEGLQGPRDREAWLATVHRGHKESDTTKSTWHARTFQEESGSSFGTSERVDTSITASGCFSPTFSKVPTASLVPELA